MKISTFIPRQKSIFGQNLVLEKKNTFGFRKNPRFGLWKNLRLFLKICHVYVSTFCTWNRLRLFFNSRLVLEKTFVMSLGCFWKKSKFDPWKNPYLALTNSTFGYLINVWSLKKNLLKKKNWKFMSLRCYSRNLRLILGKSTLHPTNSTFGPWKNHLWSMEKNPHLIVSEKKYFFRSFKIPRKNPRFVILEQLFIETKFGLQWKYL